MFNYAKSVLKVVSFDPSLFKKEYGKMVNWLSPEEGINLLLWCNETFEIDLLLKSGIL